MLARLLDTETYSAIGRRYGISHNRARQIVIKHARSIRQARPSLTIRARNSIALTWWWSYNKSSIRSTAVDAWEKIWEERSDQYLPTPTEVAERRLVPLDFLMTPNCGRETLVEITDWMNREGYWLK